MTSAAVMNVWPAIVALVGIVVWAVRVEAGMKANSSEIRSLWRQRHEDVEAQRKARDETNAMLAEIRKDVKRLLEKGGRGDGE